ncbi:hypothetical protein RGQ15_15120 [Paracoccus sp. MBLB3053]|uniref:Uncharacterized protein n=1 Tax=Paracoccus aurantius TaxID=3073814 RepID=A0ABU2HV30_9RHOB|nr:hypothetical protein [Paracoccus sp. MBLB3053]MDS9468896.1 hypothetical protein [Paracoccus sp. MBLB3053]
MMKATLILSGIQPVAGSVTLTPTGFVFAVERMILPRGEMPRDLVATLHLAQGEAHQVHIENVNVSRIENELDEWCYRGRIMLRAENAPEP